MQSTASLERQLENHKAVQNLKKFPTVGSKLKIKLALSKRDAPPAFLQVELPNNDSLSTDDYARAKVCISRIADPLWKDICSDLLKIMGAASVLKIWKSKLGEFSPFDKRFDFICDTEATAAFVRQYDFVILGSLQRYFSGLKELRVGNKPVCDISKRRMSE